MKRAVLCVPNPHDYIEQLEDFSVMIINPENTESRQRYLLDSADWSLKITKDGETYRNGNDYPNEKLFWYTSGTMGDSKFYSFSQQQLDSLCDSLIRDLELTANDRYAGIMSLWHAHGQSLFWATRKVGCQTQFFTVNQIRGIPNFQPTFISAIPDILKLVHDMPLTSLRFLRSGSAPLSNQLYLSLKEKFKVPVVEYFGMTEAMSHVLSNPLRGPQHMGTVGIPTTGVEAKIVNEHLWIRSNQAYTQDWFDTGDLAEHDQNGYFKIIGRSVDRINIKGYKIDPVSVENQIKKLLPDLESVVIFGKTSCNCVYVGPVESNDVATALKQIHPYCVPKFIQQEKVIPRADSTKISRNWLIEHYQCK
jgi:acyl-coenzyme A synthetase/AMP-(fatty) acid ligase